ncbi:MAG: hypothetical protein M3R10_02185 [Verrucomicrobiota bacterium]|nr:hypothetical protein [Verrucomicrobiota bacterium]
MRARQAREAFQVVFAIAALLVISATLTLRHVSRFGYTWSLSLFIIPIVGLALWFARRSDLQFPRAAFWRTIAVLAPLGFLLDLLFGNAFFVFPNKEATLGWNIPAIGGPIPIEEFVFYLTGFILTLLSYVWCDEYWMAAYNVPDYEAAAKGIPRIVRFHFASVILGVVLIAAAIVYRKMFSGAPAGFPWYFIYLVCASFIPSAGFLKTAQSFINWRAFSFTFFLLLLISLLWEVTLALPNEWWNFRWEMTIGLHIKPWSHLPIEEPCVWMAVSFTTIIVYEVIKIWKALGRRALSAFFGVAD